MLQVSSHDFEHIGIPLLYWFWFVEYYHTSPNKNRSLNLWHVTSILVCCIFAPAYKNEWSVCLLKNYYSWDFFFKKFSTPFSRFHIFYFPMTFYTFRSLSTYYYKYPWPFQTYKPIFLPIKLTLSFFRLMAFNCTALYYNNIVPS